MEDLEIRRHGETGDSIALASLAIYGRSSDDMLEVTSESVKPVFNREMHKYVGIACFRARLLLLPPPPPLLLLLLPGGRCVMAPCRVLVESLT